MPSLLETALHSALYQALNADKGVVVKTNDARSARAKIYTYRREVGDVELMRVHIRFSPSNPETELLLIKMPVPDTEDQP